MHLDEAGFLRVEAFQRVESVVEGEQADRLFNDLVDGVVEGKLRSVTAALSRCARAGMVNEDLAHEAGGDGQKVGAAGVDVLALVDDAGVKLADQGGGLKGVAVKFAARLGFGDFVQFRVDVGEDAVEGGFVAAGEVLEFCGDGRRLLHELLFPDHIGSGPVVFQHCSAGIVILNIGLRLRD